MRQGLVWIWFSSHQDISVGHGAAGGELSMRCPDLINTSLPPRGSSSSPISPGLPPTAALGQGGGGEGSCSENTSSGPCLMFF